jgi:hypothetical protein
VARALLKHCDIQSLVHSRSYIDDRGQVADLDPAKVVDNATKNASPALTQKVIVGLKFLSDPALTAGTIRAGTVARQGGMTRCRQDLANFPQNA